MHTPQSGRSVCAGSPTRKFSSARTRQVLVGDYGMELAVFEPPRVSTGVADQPSFRGLPDPMQVGPDTSGAVTSRTARVPRAGRKEGFDSHHAPPIGSCSDRARRFHGVCRAEWPDLAPRKAYALSVGAGSEPRTTAALWAHLRAISIVVSSAPIGIQLCRSGSQPSPRPNAKTTCSPRLVPRHQRRAVGVAVGGIYHRALDHEQRDGRLPGWVKLRWVCRVVANSEVCERRRAIRVRAGAVREPGSDHVPRVTTCAVRMPVHRIPIEHASVNGPRRRGD
jgi:hypothetical protein